MKTKLKTPTPSLLFSSDSTAFLTLLSLLPEWCRQTGNGSSSQFITFLLCHSFLITLFWSNVGSSTMGYCSVISSVWILPTSFMNCSSNVLSMAYHSSGMIWVPYVTTAPNRRPAAVFLHGPGLLHRLQENLCSGTWNISLSFFINLGVCRAVHFFFLSLTTATKHSFTLS